MKYLFVSIGLLVLGLASPADAAETRFADDDVDDGGTDCTSANPCTLQGLINRLEPGDVGIVRAGTYEHNVAITGKNGREFLPDGSPGRITLRAENPAVECPANNPDGCVVANTTTRSILNDIEFKNSNFWTVEGFQYRHIGCDSDSSNNTLRFMHGYIDDGAIGRAGHSVQLNDGCDKWLAEHGYITKTDDEGGDYGFSTFWADELTIRNYYIAGGNLHHAIAMKRGGGGHDIERVVCEGHEAQCIFVGQEMDDGKFHSNAVSHDRETCDNTKVDSGPDPRLDISDQTIQGVTLRNIFGRNANQSGLVDPVDTSRTRSVIMIDNASGVTVENVLAKVGGHPDGPVPIWIRNSGTASHPGGRCGVRRGDLEFRGVVIDAAGSANGCLAISTMGESPATLTFENVVCHNATNGGGDGIVFVGSQLGNEEAWETTKRPATTIRNSVFNDCASAWANPTQFVSFTQSHNNFFNCEDRPGIGTQTEDPRFTGPESVPIPTLPTSHFAGKWKNGSHLWDWEGEYQPIINRFRTQNAALTNAGTACARANCDIGANEFFVPLDETAWASCAFYDNGDEVFEDFTEPWLAGRAGLVVDIDCAAKKIVIGRCTDPLDEATCDNDVYIHKAAQLRKKEVNQSVVLNSGVADAPADTSDACWRTRATHDFTESLEELTGIWVRFEVDPNDDGTHTCAAPPDSVEWAFQAHK